VDILAADRTAALCLRACALRSSTLMTSTLRSVSVITASCYGSLPTCHGERVAYVSDPDDNPVALATATAMLRGVTSATAESSRADRHQPHGYALAVPATGQPRRAAPVHPAERGLPRSAGGPATGRPGVRLQASDGHGRHRRPDAVSKGRVAALLRAQARQDRPAGGRVDQGCVTSRRAANRLAGGVRPSGSASRLDRRRTPAGPSSGVEGRPSARSTAIPSRPRSQRCPPMGRSAMIRVPCSGLYHLTRMMAGG
jgi:hypothetical protein